MRPGTERIALMVCRVNVGMDPSKRECVAAVVDSSGIELGKAIRCIPACSGIAHLLSQVSKRAPEAELHFYIEASGWHWYAPAAILNELGYTVSLINPSYTKAQRKVSSRHAKSDAADARALARAPFNMGQKANHPADIPEGDRLNLQLLVRQRFGRVQTATGAKLRIIAWLGLTTPGLTDVIGTDLSRTDRALISQYPVIAALSSQGRQRVQEFLRTCSDDEALALELEQQLMDLAEEAYSPKGLDNSLVAHQIEMELEQLALLEKQIAELEKSIETLMAKCDPEGLARTLPGVGPVVAAILVAEAGTDLSRFPDAAHFASWTGLVGRSHGSSGKHVNGLPITKAGRADVKWALYMAANTAAQRDPQLKAFYDRLRAKGKSHHAAVVAVAHKLARWYWAIMTEQRPFEPREPGPEQLPQPT